MTFEEFLKIKFDIKENSYELCDILISHNIWQIIELVEEWHKEELNKITNDLKHVSHHSVEEELWRIK